jgi:hypothetical protein
VEVVKRCGGAGGVARREGGRVGARASEGAPSCACVRPCQAVHMRGCVAGAAIRAREHAMRLTTGARHVCNARNHPYVTPVTGVPGERLHRQHSTATGMRTRAQRRARRGVVRGMERHDEVRARRAQPHASGEQRRPIEAARQPSRGRRRQTWQSAGARGAGAGAEGTRRGKTRVGVWSERIAHGPRSRVFGSRRSCLPCCRANAARRGAGHAHGCERSLARLRETSFSVRIHVHLTD